MKLLICVTICVLFAAGCVAAPPPPAPTAVPPAPTAVPPTAVSAQAASQTDLLGQVNAFAAALNRCDVESASALFADDAEYRAFHVGVGKAQVRTILDYLDAIGSRWVFSNCKVEGQEVACSAWCQDDPMATLGSSGVRVEPYTFTFRDGKIVKITGTPAGAEWTPYNAASADARAWLTANRADEWKKITNESGGLIRNGQTGPEVVRLLRVYAGEKAKQNPPAATDLLGLTNAFMAAMNRRDVEGAIAMFTDDAEFRTAHVGVGKAQVRTILDYLDGTGLHMTLSNCQVEGQQVACSAWNQDAAMAALGTPGVRLEPYTLNFRDGKITKIVGTQAGPEWATYGAASTDARAWLTANRANEWKKVTDEKGGLIRNGQTGPEIIRLLRDYAKSKK
jgi:hypothetical protein